LVALLFSVPLALAAALYVSQLAGPRVREITKPVIELLAGIPSVVLGFFALIVMATVLQRVFGYASRLNALCAGMALRFSVVPDWVKWWLAARAIEFYFSVGFCCFSSRSSQTSPRKW